jgi:hypothetical protein
MENNQIRTLFVKQQHDFSGPWSSYTFEEGIEKEILNTFHSKVSLYEMLLYFKADVAIIPTQINSPWLNRFLSNKEYVDFVNNNVNGINLFELDLSKYDLIISHDPILYPYLSHIKKQYPNIILAYILAEHTSWQMHQLGLDYDLYLDHTLELANDIVRLPQSINFPFPRVPDTLRNLFNNDKDKIQYDYRSINYFVVNDLLKDNNLDKDGYSSTKEQVETFYNSFNTPLDIIKISDKTFVPFMFDLSNQDECVEYYNNLSKTKYFITIANRVGQAAADAASSGAIVFGNKLSKIHSMLCHPFTLMENNFNNQDVLDKINQLELDITLQQDILSYQDNQLKKYFIDRPKNILMKTLQIKNLDNQ